MGKLTVDDLKKIKEKHQAAFAVREGGNRAKITVHMGTCGIAAGAREVMDSLMEEMAAKDVKDVIVTTSGCAGFCVKEPMATVEIAGESPVKYQSLNAEKIKKILNEHVLGGNIVEEYALVVGSETSY
jgi:NADP-reducing hydrogenase subunit HndB